METKCATNKNTYDYFLPENLIAQHPLEKRDDSKLMVFDRKTNTVLHKHFYDIIDFLQKGDVLVLNSSRVLPARIIGTKQETNAQIEFLLQKRKDLTTWSCVAKPAKRLKIGTVVKFSDKLSLTVLEKGEFGDVTVKFNFDGVFETLLEEVGSMPLPHYIKEKLEDKERYQTIYSNQNGSSAAPTAGLHWTKELLQKAKDKGVEICYVMLHVGLGTFRPVSEDDILKHKMHSEYYEITKEVADKINKAKQEGRRVVAVGTTSVRVLESACDEDGVLQEKSGETNIFIYPPYKMKVVSSLITNFHLPKSTLIMLVSSMAGIDTTLGLYNLAVEEQYRFFSFGDSMFIV